MNFNARCLYTGCDITKSKSTQTIMTCNCTFQIILSLRICKNMYMYLTYRKFYVNACAQILRRDSGLHNALDLDSIRHRPRRPRPYLTHAYSVANRHQSQLVHKMDGMFHHIYANAKCISFFAFLLHQYCASLVYICRWNVHVCIRNVLFILQHGHYSREHLLQTLEKHRNIVTGCH